MVVELLTSMVGLKIYKRIKNRDLVDIRKRWDRLLLSSNTNLTNYYGETFVLKKIYRTPKGYKLHIIVPYSLRITTLKEIEIDMVRVFNCSVDIYSKNNSFIIIDLNYTDLGG